MTSAPRLDESTRARALQPQQTARLLLQPTSPADRQTAGRLYLDAEVMLHIAPGGAINEEEVGRRVVAAETRWRQVGFDMWTLLERDSGDYVGRGGLIFSEELDEVEVGYMLVREKWGHGFATELTIFALSFGFATLGLDRVVAVVDVPHTRSQHVLEKAGMRYEKDTTYEG
ncbi:MAG TPA: GNAT family N-acetyltransferase, partial [Candidatus Dormibacteraeota bacterium]|nr:GNAT family N-acetyltransferase [Candidatus Dormibacteraeota bacterium]